MWSFFPFSIWINEKRIKMHPCLNKRAHFILINRERDRKKLKNLYFFSNSIRTMQRKWKQSNENEVISFRWDLASMANRASRLNQPRTMYATTIAIKILLSRCLCFFNAFFPFTDSSSSFPSHQLIFILSILIFQCIFFFHLPWILRSRVRHTLQSMCSWFCWKSYTQTQRDNWNARQSSAHRSWPPLLIKPLCVVTVYLTLLNSNVFNVFFSSLHPWQMPIVYAN